MRVSKLQSPLSVSTLRWGNGHTWWGLGEEDKVVVNELKLLKSFWKDAWQQGVPSQLIRVTERLWELMETVAAEVRTRSRSTEHSPTCWSMRGRQKIARSMLYRAGAKAAPRHFLN